MTGDPFPEAPWVRDDVALLLKPYYAVAGTSIGSRLVRRAAPLDDWLMRKTGGRLTFFGSPSMRLLVLSTIGRKSGQRRDIALTYWRDEDRLFLLGSNFGQRHHPAWSANLLSNPDAWVTVAGTEIPVTATPLTGDERARALSQFLTRSIYRTYVARTDRELRLFALTRR